MCSRFVGLQGNCWFTNHKSSFNHKEQAHSASLSTYVWKLKEQNKPFTITWSIKALAPSYNKETKSCQLYIMEKTLIIIENKEKSLNKRTEILNKCWHRDKELVMNQYFFKIQITLIRQLFPLNIQTEKILEYSARTDLTEDWSLTIGPWNIVYEDVNLYFLIE